MTQVEVCSVKGGGPEDVLALANGDIVTGTLDGKLQRISAAFDRADEVIQTGKRALGLDLLPDGRVLCCDPNGSVFAADLENGAVEVLADTFEGKPLGVCNNPAVAADGTIYYSTSTERNSVFDATKDIVEGIPTGRLYRLSVDGALEMLVDGLLFANGVAVAPDQMSVLIAETGRAKITRVWLDGPKAGESEVFAENMAGLPDNLSVSEDCKLLVAWVQPKGADFERITNLPYFLRWLIVRLPSWAVPSPVDRLMMARYDFDGTLLGAVDLEGVGFHFVTGVRQSGDWVYMGSFEEDAVARLPYADLCR